MMNLYIVKDDDYKKGHYIYDNIRKDVKDYIKGLKKPVSFILGFHHKDDLRIWNASSKEFQIYIEGSQNPAVTPAMIEAYKKYPKDWGKNIGGMYT